MKDCVFCKIGRRELEAMIVYDDEAVIAFRDINPQAPAHILVVPKAHYASLNELPDNSEALLGHLMRVCLEIARLERLDLRGYRVIVNTGQDAGQNVGHLHFHLMGGREMGWPPG